MSALARAEPAPTLVTVLVIVAGDPVAKGRPRMTKTGIAYTPGATRKYEAHARQEAQDAMEGREPLFGPVHVSVKAVFPIPASWSQVKQRRSDGGPVTRRPDIDNLIKSALDCLNGIVLGDDAQVFAVRAAKIYGRKPRLEIEVTAS